MLHKALGKSMLLSVIPANVRGRDALRALDVHLPRAAMLCWEATDAGQLQCMTRAHPDTGVVVLAESLSSEQAQALVGCGAAAALDRTASRNLLITATVLAGYGMQMEPRHRAPIQADRARSEHALRTLTRREAEILGLLDCGESTTVIAELLGVSRHTVKAQARAVYRKLGVHSRAELRELRRRRNASGDGAVMRLDVVRQERRRVRPAWMRAPLTRASRL
jgi:DNA-binding NarL/FixJ family response regulator